MHYRNSAEVRWGPQLQNNIQQSLMPRPLDLLRHQRVLRLHNNSTFGCITNEVIRRIDGTGLCAPNMVVCFALALAFGQWGIDALNIKTPRKRERDHHENGQPFRQSHGHHHVGVLKTMALISSSCLASRLRNLTLNEGVSISLSVVHSSGSRMRLRATS